jgi:NADH pyrophosphatase NudC (nudix superfamily)
VSVAAVIEQNGRFLIVEERCEGQIVFNQPAGYLEKGENFITAVVRETLEETTWQFEPTALIGIYLYTSPMNGAVYQRLCFTGHPIQQDMTRSLDKDIIAAHWLTREDLFERLHKLRTPMVLRCIDDYRRGIRYPLRMLVDLDQELGQRSMREPMLG